MNLKNFIIKTLCIIMSVSFLSVGIADAWWDSNWTKRKPIEINYTGSLDGNNYQLKLNIEYDPYMKIDFSDIRFVFNNSTIPHFLEKKESGINASFWINVSLNNTNNITVYMYYGNEDANDVSDFEAVFTKNYNESGLEGLWHLDEGSGDEAIDTSGNNRNATLSNIMWNGKDGGQWNERSDLNFSTGDSILLDGSSSVMTVPSFNLANFSVEMWVNSRNWTSDSFETFWKRGLSQDINGYYWWGYRLGDNGFFFRYSDGDSQYQAQTWAFSPAINTNYHMVLTFDNITNKLTLYVNGANKGTKTITLVHPSSGDYYFGRYDSPKYYFNGTLDEIRIYNRVLPSNEITRHFYRSKYVSPAPVYSVGSMESLTPINLTENVDLKEDYVIFYEEFSNNNSLKKVGLNSIFGGASDEGVNYSIQNDALYVDLSPSDAERQIDIKGFVPLPESEIEIGVRNDPSFGSWIHVWLIYGSLSPSVKKIDMYYYYSDSTAMFKITNGSVTLGPYYPSISGRYLKNGYYWDKYKFVIHKNHSISVYGNDQFMLNMKLAHDSDIYYFAYPKFLVFKEDYPPGGGPDYWIDYVKQTVPRKLITFTHPKAIGLTFDGQYQEIYENAFPMLKSYGWTATNAITTPYVGNPESIYMNWDRLNEMKEAGWTTGLHTIDLFSVPDYKEEFDDEVLGIYNNMGEYPKEWIMLAGAENYSMVEYGWYNWSIMDRQMGVGGVFPYLFDIYADYKIPKLFESDTPIIITYTHRVQNETDPNYAADHDYSITNFSYFLDNASKKGYFITGIYDIWKMLLNQQEANISNIFFNESYYEFNLTTNDRNAYLNIYDYFNLNNKSSLYILQELNSNNFQQIYSTFPHSLDDSFNVRGKNKTYRLSKKMFLGTDDNTSVNITVNVWDDINGIYVFNELCNNQSANIYHEVVVNKKQHNYTIFLLKNGTLVSTKHKTSNEDKKINFTINEYDNILVEIQEDKTITYNKTFIKNTWHLFNNWTNDITFSEINNTYPNITAIIHYNSSHNFFYSFLSGWFHNVNYTVPANDNVIITFSENTTIQIHSSQIPSNYTIPSSGWYYTYLYGSQNRTIEDILNRCENNCSAVAYYDAKEKKYLTNNDTIIKVREGFAINITGEYIWERIV